MANPGYPMQPMMQPPMQQMGQQHMPPAVKRGTSKAVPVVVSAGLAVGVFCGLLFGLGTDKDEAVAAPTAETKKQADTEVPEPFKPTTNTVAKPTQKPATGSNAVATAGSGTPATGSGATGSGATGSGATPATGSGSAGKPATVPAVKPPAKLTVEITPEAVAKTAKITIDGKELEANVLEVDLGDAKEKEVKVVVKASGYKDYEAKVKILADQPETKFTVELVKRWSSSGNGNGNLPRPPPPGGNGTGKKPPPGGGKKPNTGIIDI